MHLKHQIAMKVVPMSQYFARSSEVLCENIDDELVILNIKDGYYYGLNLVGAILWEALAQPRTIKDLYALVNQEFTELSAEEVQRDVDHFLNAMLEPALVNVDATMA